MIWIIIYEKSDIRYKVSFGFFQISIILKVDNTSFINITFNLIIYYITMRSC